MWREMFAISLTVHNAHTSDSGTLTSWELHVRTLKSLLIGVKELLCSWPMQKSL